jgi:rubredoxin
MLLSTAFAALLLLVVVVYYLVPRRRSCPGCGAKRDPESPLCTECGWIHDDPEDPAEDGEDDAEQDVVAEPWRGE